MNSIFAIKRDTRSNDWVVYLKRNGKPYFYHANKAECRAWIERNGEDENN